MPTYVVEHQGKKYKVKADSPEQAAAAFGPAPEPKSAGQRIKDEFTGPAMDQFLSGVAQAPMAFLEGAGGLALDVGKLLTPEDSAIGQRIIAQEQRFDEGVQRRRAAAEERVPGSTDVADVAAGLVPVAAGKVKAATTLTKALARGMGEGAIAANIAHQADDDRILNTAIGALAPAVFVGGGAALTTATGGKVASQAKQAVLNASARLIKRRQDKQTQTMMQEAQLAFTNPSTGGAMAGKDDWTVAQASGDARLNRLAQTSVDKTARDIVRQQLDQRLKNVQAVADAQNVASVRPEVRAEKIHGLVTGEARRIQKAATDNYGRQIDALRASPEGQAIRVPVDPLKAAILDLEKTAGDIFGRLPQGSELAKTVRMLKSGNVRELKLDGLVKLQQEINATRTFDGGIPSDADKVARMVGTRLRRAIDATIDGTPNAPGYGQLRAINAEYRAQMTELRRFKANQISKLFGKDSVMENPDQAFDAFLALPASAQKRGVQLLGDHSPEMLSFFRKRYLDKVLDSATSQGGPSMRSALDIDKLYEGLTGDALKKSPLFDAQEKAWAAAAARDLRIINNMNPDPTRIGSDLPPAEVTMNIVSRSAEFMTRLLTRAITGIKFEDILFTREGREAITTVKNIRTADQSARNRAAGYLMGVLMSEPQEEEAQ